MAKMKTGEIVLLSEGAYSDYEVKALGRVKLDFEPEPLVAEWLSLHPEQRGKYKANLNGFMAWLMSEKGLIEEMNYREIHLGDYSTLEPKVYDKDKQLCEQERKADE